MGISDPRRKDGDDDDDLTNFTCLHDESKPRSDLAAGVPRRAGNFGGSPAPEHMARNDGIMVPDWLKTIICKL